MSRPAWHDWLLETGLPVAPGDNIRPESLAIYAAVGKMRDNMEAIPPGDPRHDVAQDALTEVRDVRTLLVVETLLTRGQNPYHESVGREEWLHLVELETAYRDNRYRLAASWARKMGYIRTENGSHQITPAGLGAIRGLTPYNE